MISRFSIMYETPEGVRKIIFQYIKCSVMIADQINSGDVNINIVRNIYALHFAQVVRAGVNKIDRYNTVFKNELLVINILQKKIKCRNRCLIPRSMKSHSLAVMIRGIISKGNIFSMPSPLEYTVKVMPWLMKSLLASSSFLPSSSAGMLVKNHRHSGSEVLPSLHRTFHPRYWGARAY